MLCPCHWNSAFTQGTEDLPTELHGCWGLTSSFCFPSRVVDEGPLPSLCWQQQAEPILTSTSKVTFKTTTNSKRGSYRVGSRSQMNTRLESRLRRKESYWDCQMGHPGTQPWAAEQASWETSVGRLGNRLFYSWAFSIASWATVTQWMKYCITA